ncbi:hypothetical protein E4U19_004494 [Claviceps sp. Clav32 group G5]|nr:hypothetical protein E4U19_004494 [Claviceps sp. Clav32 group G5]
MQILGLHPSATQESEGHQLYARRQFERFGFWAENQEFQDELSIPMEIRGLRTDQGNEASKPESANNSKHQWRRGSVPSDDRIMKHEGRQEAEGFKSGRRRPSAVANGAASRQQQENWPKQHTECGAVAAAVAAAAVAAAAAAAAADK